MIEETVLNNEIIQNLVKEKYNIEVTNISKLNRGSANLYSLNNDIYVLKEFQTKYSKEEIDKEIKIINHLKKDGLNVPEYVPTIENDYSFIYNNHVIVLQKFIEGYTIESNTATYEQTLESAKILGQIINSLKTLDIELPINDVSEWYSLETLNEGIDKLSGLINKVDGENKDQIVKDLQDKIEMIEYIKNNVNLDEMNNLTCMNTHGDYSLLQFIYKDGKINAVIDFVSACKMPIVWEVIRSYSYIDSEVKDGEINIDNLVEYVKEFTKYVKLNEYDIKYMPYLYLIQLLPSTFGYKQYISDNTKTSLLDFGLFRTKLCRNLFENLEKISSQLEKEILNN